MPAAPRETGRITVLPDAGPEEMTRSAVRGLSYVGLSKDGDPSCDAVREARDNVIFLISSSRIPQPFEIRAIEAVADDVAKKLNDPDYPGDNL